MAAAGKLHHFTQNPHFLVLQQAGEAVVERTQKAGESLGMDFPTYQVRGLANAADTQGAELQLLHRDLVSRILHGGDMPGVNKPSESYVRRLLSHHFKRLRSLRSRTEFLSQLQQALEPALHQAEAALSAPSYWDYEVDPELGHLDQKISLLEKAVAWASEQSRRLKADRLKEKGPNAKVLTLAYRLLWEAGALPPRYKTLSMELAEYIADQIKQYGGIGKASTVDKYLGERNSGAPMFINTKPRFEQALSWIEQEWPDVDRKRLKPLPGMVPG